MRTVQVSSNKLSFISTGTRTSPRVKTTATAGPHGMIARHWLCGPPAFRQARSITAAASRAGASHAVVYHEDFALSPLPDGHRFPMPKDHLLYCELQRRGWVDRTFRPAAPDVDTLSLVRASPWPSQNPQSNDSQRE